MNKSNKIRISSAKKDNLKIFLRNNNDKFINFSNKKFNQKLPVLNDIIDNHQNKLIRSNDIFSNNFLKKDKQLNFNQFRLNNNKNNKEKIKENDRYNKFINKPKVNQNANLQKRNMLAKVNISLPIKKKNNFKLNSNNNFIINPIVPIKNINNNKINVNKSVDNKLLQNYKNNNNNIININNNRIKVSAKNNIRKGISDNINNIKFKINQQQIKNQNINKSVPKSNAPNIILMSKTSAKGLANIGATCYMNATLQCLAHIQRLTHHLLNSENKKKIFFNTIKYKLSSAYLTVLENLWQNKNINYYSPNQFKDVISEMNNLFAGIQANDSKDLVLFILETMHKELNIEKNNINPQSNNVDDSKLQYNYELTFKNFLQFFKENYNSIISNLFYAMFNSAMTCQNCNIAINNVQCYNLLIFPLQRVKEFKMKSDNAVDLFDCFDYYQRPDYIGGKSFYCHNCRNMVDNVNITKLLYGPKILIINLNRGKGLEFDVKINFPEYIDITNYVYYKDNMPTFYELIGIVTHFGPSSMGGHFIAFCKSFGDQKWYKYNDAMVDPSSFEEAKNTGVPYILFYSYIKR